METAFGGGVGPGTHRELVAGTRVWVRTVYTWLHTALSSPAGGEAQHPLSSLSLGRLMSGSDTTLHGRGFKLVPRTVQRARVEAARAA